MHVDNYYIVYTGILKQERTMKKLRKINAQLDKINSLLKSEDKFNKDISNWSSYKQLEHILIVKKNLTELIIKNKEPEEKKPRTFLSYVVLIFGHIPRGKAKAPSIVEPQGVAQKELEKLLDEVKESIEGIREGKYQADLVVMNHPYFGGLTSSECLRFLEVHTNHHLKIINDISS